MGASNGTATTSRVEAPGAGSVPEFQSTVPSDFRILMAPVSLLVAMLNADLMCSPAMDAPAGTAATGMLSVSVELEDFASTMEANFASVVASASWKLADPPANVQTGEPVPTPTLD